MLTNGVDRAQRVAITSVRFRNFKALKRYSVSLGHMNVLVGPNNSGKSTVISAFRVLAVALRTARAYRPTYVEGPGGISASGYRLTSESVPISLENVRTDYDAIDATITFRLSNANELELFFPADGGCVLIPRPKRDRQIVSPTGFRGAYPVQIGVVPPLGPVEADETLRDSEYVRRVVETRLSPRHFRNYWYHFPDNWDEFRRLLGDTWPGMEVERPHLLDASEPRLTMFCKEHRIPRELAWSGSGFQVWCQTLTHLTRAADNTIIVVDEPEIYLHPDLQRQLLRLLRSAGPDVLFATHSAEFLAEAEPAELLMMDRSRASAQRIKRPEEVSLALSAIGSNQNSALTQAGRTRRVLFVEGDDASILREFASRMGLLTAARQSSQAVVPLGGSPSADRVRSVAEGFVRALGEQMRFAAVLDRDYRSDGQIAVYEREVGDHVGFAHVWRRKEIENYLLVPEVLDRAIAAALADRRRRTGKGISSAATAAELLTEITDLMKHDTQSQLVERRVDFERGSRKDRATIAKPALAEFDERWSSLEGRLEMVAGKKAVARLNTVLKERYGIQLTPKRIIPLFEVAEVPLEMRTVLRKLDSFAKKTS